MDIIWNIDDEDIKKVNQLLKENDNPFLRKRKERNIDRQGIVIDIDTIIHSMLMCLLTSQQRSNSGSRVSKFLRKKPFPITITTIEEAKDVRNFITETLRENELTRYINRISDFFAENMKKIEGDNWAIIEKLKVLKYKPSKKNERVLADYLDNWLKGFGPKQSRNFLQSLGLTRYEIPIDSRITKWLNNFGFPVTLTSGSLGNTGYYHFVSDGIQILTEKAGTYPCLLDAAIFSSFDNKGWTEENIVY